MLFSPNFTACVFILPPISAGLRLVPCLCLVSSFRGIETTLLKLYIHRTYSCLSARCVRTPSGCVSNTALASAAVGVWGGGRLPGPGAEAHVPPHRVPGSLHPHTAVHHARRWTAALRGPRLHRPHGKSRAPRGLRPLHRAGGDFSREASGGM